MNKTILLISVSLLLFVSAKAQQNKSGFSIEVSGGPSFPVGNFASMDTANRAYYQPGEQEGWAKTGIGINIIASYQFTPTYGISLEVGGQRNKRANEPMDKMLRERYSQYNLKTDIKTGAWKIGKILAGGFITLPISHSGKTFFHGRILAGVCKTAIPGDQFHAFNQDASPGDLENLAMVGNAKHGKTPLPWTFSYQISAGLKHFLSKQLFLTASVGYFGASAVLEKGYYANFDPMETDWGPFVQVKKQYDLNSIIPTVGIGWAFR